MNLRIIFCSVVLFWFVIGADCLKMSEAGTVESEPQPTAPAPENPSSALQGRELTLEECYQLALKQSERIAVQESLIKQAEGQFLQSLSTILPSIDFFYSQEYQDDGRNSSVRTPVPEAKFVFSQPLFSGFKEFAAINAGRAQERQRDYEKIRAEQLLFMDVADAFYLFLTYQEDFSALITTHDALKERVGELKKREELGRSRPSEVASAESRLSRIEADMELVENQMETVRQLLEFLVGRTVEEISDADFVPMPFSGEEEFLVKVGSRPDILAAKAAWEGAKSQITVARSGFWPQASLDSNYYTKRDGSLENVDWDVTLSVDVPIFSGGQTLGEVKEANAKAEQARLEFEEIKRQATLEVRNAYIKWQADLRRKTSLDKALKASEKNYELQKEDYNLSLVNNLTVLAALEELQATRREYIIVKSEAQRSYWRLQIASGKIF